MNYDTLIAPQHAVSSDGPLKENDYLNIKKAAMVLRAVNHGLRQKIIQTIYEHKRISVTDLYVKLRLEQSVASQHLAILRKANVVTTVREGKFIYYAVNHERIDSIMNFVNNLVK
ncbi:MAG: helix-turn-helix transcriptional regulator [Chitinophagaceae bacterium]|nr:helix-turn-helix transcriptional regulator [Chitinophagaceae bacterium]